MGTFVTADATPTLFDDKEAVPGQTAHGLTNAQVPRAVDFNVMKAALFDCRAAGRSYAVPGADVYDVRDLATGGNVANGSSTQDTEALLRAVALTTNDADSTTNRPAIIRLPKELLLLEQELSLYGAASTASAWIGENGRSKGPDGTRIKWVGAAKGVMMHSYGCNGTLFRDICWDGSGGGTARFCFWAETNQRNGGNGSSDMKWADCTFTSWGHMGVGMVCGDEIRGTVTLSGVVGTFTAGEFVLTTNDTAPGYDAIGTVVSWTAGTGALVIKEQLGAGFRSSGLTMVGLTSGATGTTNGYAIDADYQGNLQFSEACWEDCRFIGQGSVGVPTTDGWAGWATFGSNNNKDYELRKPHFESARYGIDWCNGSGHLTVTSAEATNIGQGGKGSLCRALGGNLEWTNGNFENGASTRKSRIFDLSNIKADISGGDYYALLPTDLGAIRIGHGVVNLNTISLGSESTEAKIFLGTSAAVNLNGVNWREDFTGYLPIEDFSGNPLGGQGNADATRTTDLPYTARGCVANCNSGAGGIRLLPNIIGTPLSPSRNQLLDDSLTANSAVVQRGILSCSSEARTLTFTQVKAAGGAVHFAKTKGKAVIRGVVWDVTTTFRGGLLSAMTLSVGNTSSPTAYKGAADVWTATGQSSTFGFVLAPWAGDDIVATFTPTGAAISALTQGSVTVYALYEVLL